MPRPARARSLLIDSATDLIRRRGYAPTSVDDICAAAGVTKGAFFHHFESKEALAGACLARWREQMTALLAGAAFHAEADPTSRLVGCMDFLISVLNQPGMLKSCLAGTIVQEASESSGELRSAAGSCFAAMQEPFEGLVRDAARSRRRKIDAGALARLWLAAVQGSLVLYKATGDESVIKVSMTHVRSYIVLLLGGGATPKRRRRVSRK